MTKRERTAILQVFRLISFVLYHLITKETKDDAKRELGTLDREIDRFEKLGSD